MEFLTGLFVGYFVFKDDKGNKSINVNAFPCSAMILTELIMIFMKIFNYEFFTAYAKDFYLNVVILITIGIAGLAITVKSFRLITCDDPYEYIRYKSAIISFSIILFFSAITYIVCFGLT